MTLAGATHAKKTGLGSASSGTGSPIGTRTHWHRQAGTGCPTGPPRGTWRRACTRARPGAKISVISVNFKAQFPRAPSPTRPGKCPLQPDSECGSSIMPLSMHSASQGPLAAAFFVTVASLALAVGADSADPPSSCSLSADFTVQVQFKVHDRRSLTRPHCPTPGPAPNLNLFNLKSQSHGGVCLGRVRVPAFGEHPGLGADSADEKAQRAPCAKGPAAPHVSFKFLLTRSWRLAVWEQSGEVRVELVGALQRLARIRYLDGKSRAISDSEEHGGTAFLPAISGRGPLSTPTSHSLSMPCQ